MPTSPSCRARPCSSGQRDTALELLQTAHHRWHWRVRKARLPVGHADFADIDVTPGIQREAMRRQELSGREPGTVLAPEPRDTRALAVQNGEAGAEIGNPAIDRHARAEFADNEIGMTAAAAMQRAGTMQIIPLGFISAIAVEHLHAMVLAVGDIDETIGVG